MSVGFSKGGFYHHFDSKLAVLEAICQQRAEELSQSAMTGRWATESDCLRKTQHALLASSTLWQSENPGFVMLLIQAAYCENGALMREKMKACQLFEHADGASKAGVARRRRKAAIFLLTTSKTTAGLVLRLYMQFADEIAFSAGRARTASCSFAIKAIDQNAGLSHGYRADAACALRFHCAHRNEDPAGAHAALPREKLRKRANDLLAK